MTQPQASVSVSQSFQNLLDTVFHAIPKILVFLVVLVVGWIVAKVVRDVTAAALSGLSYGRFVAAAASVAIIALGVIAALDQVGIAAAVTQPVLIAVLATIGAILAIGVGGGLVRPMQERWERMLNSAERETSAHLAAYQRGREHAMNAPAQDQRDQAAPEGIPAATEASEASEA